MYSFTTNTAIVQNVVRQIIIILYPCKWQFHFKNVYAIYKQFYFDFLWYSSGLSLVLASIPFIWFVPLLAWREDTVYYCTHNFYTLIKMFESNVW